MQPRKGMPMTLPPRDPANFLDRVRARGTPAIVQVLDLVDKLETQAENCYDIGVKQHRTKLAVIAAEASLINVSGEIPCVQEGHDMLVKGAHALFGIIADNADQDEIGDALWELADIVRQRVLVALMD